MLDRPTRELLDRVPIAPQQSQPMRCTAQPAALALIEDLKLDRYYLFHAIRADLLRRLERYADAAAAYQAALERTDNAAERSFLERRLAQTRERQIS
jgi:predicted RNA polymerase sigma factor